MHNELHELQSRTEGVVSVDEANNELCLQIMEINPIMIGMCQITAETCNLLRLLYIDN